MTRREGAQVVGLWLVLAALRWLAALPVTQPRIFRDELLHWQLAHTFITHRPFLVSGEVVDYPAFLYPALLSLGLHTSDAHLAFQIAHGLNALMVSAAVFFAYALGRELSDHRDAVAVAALAGLAPGGGYSLFIMEENLYYPLFVASCWLCWRVLVDGRTRDAAWCALALGLTYFAKPLAVPLVAAYAGVVLLWAVTEMRSAEHGRRRLEALAVRLAPVLAFGALLLVRHALTARGVDETRTGAVLGRFYTDELGGALLPPLKPMIKVMLSLSVALAFGVAIAPAVALLGGWRERRADRRRLWLAAFAICVAAVYVLAAARHTMVLNTYTKIHERYLFAVGPLFLALFLTARGRSLGAAPIAAACVALVAVVVRIADILLAGNTWVNAPSLTLPWLVYSKMGSSIAVGLLMGAAAAAICWSASSPERMRGALRFGTLGATLLVLNAAWYGFVYRIQRDLAPLEQTLHDIETLAPGDARITIVVPADKDPVAFLSYHGKFWLDERLTLYWTGTADPPWYIDMRGDASEAVTRTRATHLVGLPGVEALCPGGVALPASKEGDGLGVRIVAVPADGCSAR
ncbi:MAG TPA: glycosyltransferase family 39 protein [Gemmatimonadaceae bacterium]|nr:glycosyltransferase family 39 protein [Gemmatimonadaceae bacterium]